MSVDKSIDRDGDGPADGAGLVLQDEVSAARSFLDALAEGDADFLAEMLGLLLDSLGRGLTLAEFADDPTRLVLALHDLKGTTASAGMDGLAAVIASLEDRAPRLAPSQREAEIAGISVALATVIDGLSHDRP